MSTRPPSNFRNVSAAGARDWPVYLPAGCVWIHFWSGARHDGGDSVTVAAPFGEPPVFYRADSAFADLFAAIGARRGAPALGLVDRWSSDGN